MDIGEKTGFFCYNCRFWEQGDIRTCRPNFGFCRRYPPSRPEPEELRGPRSLDWPKTHSKDWCGEHRWLVGLNG